MSTGAIYLSFRRQTHLPRSVITPLKVLRGCILFILLNCYQTWVIGIFSVPVCTDTKNFSVFIKKMYKNTIKNFLLHFTASEISTINFHILGHWKRNLVFRSLLKPYVVLKTTSYVVIQAGVFFQIGRTKVDLLSG